VTSKQGQAFLHARQIAMTQNGLDARKLTVKVEDEKLHRLLLGWRTGIRDATARRQTALVTDTDRPGYPEKYAKELIKQTGDKFLVPETK
jgi:peptidase, family C69